MDAGHSKRLGETGHVLAFQCHQAVAVVLRIEHGDLPGRQEMGGAFSLAVHADAGDTPAVSDRHRLTRDVHDVAGPHERMKEPGRTDRPREA